MIYTLKNKDGLIYAYLDWTLTDAEWKLKNDGEYFIVQDIWIHPDYRNKGLLKEFIRKIKPNVPSAKWLVRERREKGKPWQYFPRHLFKLQEEVCVT